jgi:hypothetical protein
MNIMTMPGFTAESSVYRTSRHYQMTAGVAAHGNVVQPQICDTRCLSNCRSVCRGDFPPGSAQNECFADCFNECCNTVPVTCGPCVCTCSRGCSDGSVRPC